VREVIGVSANLQYMLKASRTILSDGARLPTLWVVPGGLHVPVLLAGRNAFVETAMAFLRE
jgi:hypothetical protein